MWTGATFSFMYQLLIMSRIVKYSVLYCFELNFYTHIGNDNLHNIILITKDLIHVAINGIQLLCKYIALSYVYTCTDV